MHLVWFRRDLRLHDHPALSAALPHGEVIALYSLAEESRPLGPASAAHRDQTLAALAGQLEQRGIRLYVSSLTMEQLLAELVPEGLWVNDEGHDRAEFVRRFGFLGQRFHHCNARWLPQPPRRFSVYTHFARWAWSELARNRVPALGPLQHQANSPELAPHLGQAVVASGVGGEQQAWHQASYFIEHLLTDYADKRNLLAWPCSGLSSFLSWGEISVRTLAQQLLDTTASAWHQSFIGELLWRAFAWHTFVHHPDMTLEPLQPIWRSFPWREADSPAFTAWTEGRTGFAVVDAAMRQLLHQGHIHNRARMVAANFLTHHLGIHWHHGEAHFWHHLADADPALNPFNWQWVAGCGRDAAPYWRMFNPLLQGPKFDPEGLYVAEHCPELAAVAPNQRHHTLTPMLDIRLSRQAALERYRQWQEQR